MELDAKNTNALSSVTVVVVTYNSAHCLPALDALLSVCPHLMISDNGSDDRTAEWARQRWPKAQVLAHGVNLGFGAANNRALALVRTPFALLLNPDCEMTPEALVDLLLVAEQMPEAALLAPQLLDVRGQADVNYRWPHLVWRSKGPGVDAPACVGFVCGAAMLLRTAHFSRLGYFDEDFFLYYEDDDLCWRLFQARLPMVIVPQVVAIHRNRGSVKGKRPWRSEYWRGYHHAQSKLVFASKHQSLSAAQRLRWLTWLGASLAIPLRLLAFSPRLLARLCGRWMGLLFWKESYRES